MAGAERGRIFALPVGVRKAASLTADTHGAVLNTPSGTALTTAPLRTPTVVIRRRQGLFSLDLRALWDYRELVYCMVWRDLKTRYKQTAIGIGWVVIQPILTVMIFTVVFSYFARMPSEGLPYPLFAFSALLPWTYFSQAVSRSGVGLVSNANLISKVYFPRLIVPLAAAATPLVDFLLAFIVLLGLMVWYGVFPSASIMALPLFVVLAFAAALAIGLWLSALNVKYRDIGHIIPFLVQVWMYASPVVYPLSLVPPTWRTVYGLNPMATVIEGFRWCLLGAPRPDLVVATAGTAAVAVLLLGGLLYFKKTERAFADLI